jgi:hypothetical protein
MQITVQIKSTYGNENIYPVCDTAKLFADIAGTKTLTFHVIDRLKKAGYSIQVQQAVKTL